MKTIQPIRAFALLGFLLVGCRTSQLITTSQQGTVLQQSGGDVTIFLLERDIPQDIERLGVAIIPTNISSTNGFSTTVIDNGVKRQLADECRRAGANGAYRINDGTYSPYTVSYLIFRYRR